MAAYINTNIASLNSQRNLNASQAGLTTALQRLSSGLRINSSKDDAAGLAIADRMTSQVNGLTQAARNANDGISLAQTAEGALSSIGDSLQRVRTLALQSANSTNSASDRASLNSEVQSALAEIGRVSTTTQFNGLNLLDGTFSNSQFQVGANANQTISVTIAGASTSDLGSYQATSTAVTSTAFDGTGFSVNGIAIGASVAAGAVTADSATAKATSINAMTSQTGVTATANATTVTGAGPVAGSTGLNSGDLTINGIAVGAIASGATAVAQGKNTADAINAVSSQTGVSASHDLSTGTLTLTANDGRNVAVAAGNSLNTAAGAQKIQNATGLDISAGANASGHEVGTIVFGAGNEGAAGGITSGATAGAGDTITVGEKTYQFVTASGNTTSGNVGVVVAAGATMDTAIAALTTQINAESTAGRATVTAAYASGSNTLTLTSAKWGTSNITGSTSLTDGTAVGTAYAATTAGTAAADGGGNTARGTLTLNSSQTYTLTGANLGNAGLASASISKATISTVDITTVKGSNNAIALVDGALAQINSQRATLGAMQNRFTSAITNLQTSSENISAARSRIQDTDFAAETAALTRGQILQQAGTAMLAQANSLPNGVLALLRG